MKIIHASDYGIKSEKEISKELSKLFEYARITDGEKTVVMEKGVYFIDSRNCEKHMLYITNTVGDSEFAKSETPHLNRAALYLNGISDLIFDGNNSILIVNGKATNAVIESCKNITFKNLEIRHSNPDLHELKVIRKGLFCADFEIDRESLYEIKNNELTFYGEGYRSTVSKNAGWIGLIRKDTPNKIKRVLHPMFSSLKIRDIGAGKIRAVFPNTHRFKTGDRYYIFDTRRQYVGIFINKSENVVIENIKQRFNYSLALVAQDSENLTVDSVEFAPEKSSALKMASIADFIQICMCRGKTVVKNSYFDGAGDDLLNIHGIHFKITEINGNDLTVRFMHPQTHGFDPLRVGDKIAFINPKTLLQVGTAEIESSALINEYEIRLRVSSEAHAKIGYVIEDIDACSQLEFKNNTSTRIITRGLLITTRAKVNVENNRFISTSMSGILLSDDAENWYESGMCRDVTIKNNIFEYCGDTPILIKPENKNNMGAVHKNIKIVGNEFGKYSGECIAAKSTEDLTVKENKNAVGIKLKDCKNVVYN